MNDTPQDSTRHELTGQHRAYLNDHAISNEVIDAAGIWSAVTPAEVPLQFTIWGAGAAPCIVFPHARPGGESVLQIRPDTPLTRPDGEQAKYIFPGGIMPVLTVHPFMRERVMDPAVPAVIIEGTKQYLAAVSCLRQLDTPFAAIGVSGCYGWCRNGAAVPDLHAIGWAGREVTLIFDADVATNRHVHDAARQLTEVLLTAGAASVRYAMIPGAGSAGLDDVLGPAGDAPAVLAAIIGRARDKLGRPPRKGKGRPPSDIYDSGAPLPPGSASHLHTPPAQPPPLAFELDILRQAVVMLRVHRGVTGEQRNLKLLYLVFTSRLLAEPVNAVLKGLSASGKSYAVESVAWLMPPEAVFAMTAMSERALVYLREPLAHRTIVLAEAVALQENREKAEGNMAAYIVRSLLSEGQIRYPVVVKNPETGELVTQTVVIDGPTNLITSTTTVSLHAENETRMLSLPSDDSPAQTRAIMVSAADERKRGDADLSQWHGLQRWIAARETAVIIPYAHCVARQIPPAAVRLRRDWNAVRSLIRAHALLHQCSRWRSNPDGTGAVFADLDDYDAVRSLANDLIADQIGAEVPPSVRATVEVVASITASSGWATVRQVAAVLGIERSAAQYRLASAARRGYVVNLTTVRGQPAHYRTGDPLPETLAVLPRREQVCTGPCSHGPAVIAAAQPCECTGVCRCEAFPGGREAAVSYQLPDQAAMTRAPVPPAPDSHLHTPPPPAQTPDDEFTPPFAGPYLTEPAVTSAPVPPAPDSHLHTPRRGWFRDDAPGDAGTQLSPEHQARLDIMLGRRP